MNRFLGWKKQVPISHLLFVDDLLIFGRVDETIAFKLRGILESFSKISRQKINEGKSRLTLLLYGESSPAKECMTSKYVWESFNTSFRKGSFLWKDIRKGASLLRTSLAWKVGSGEKIN